MLLRRNPLLLFGAFALLANLAISLMLHYKLGAAVIAASCADLIITLPAVYYLLVVRAGMQPVITIIPVFLSGLLRASFIVPASGWIKIAVALFCEVGIAWFVVRSGRNGLIARIIASELSIVRIALTGWWMKPDVPVGGRPFSMHRVNGSALLFYILAWISVIEAVCVHLLVHRFSPITASVIS